MKDEVDTTTRWVCPTCGEPLETDFAQMQAQILVHRIKCAGRRKEAETMAIVNVNYGCGCGFRSKTTEEAISHADNSKHELTVSGSIKPSEPRAQRAKSSPSGPVKAHRRIEKAPPVAVLAKPQTESTADLSNLRARLLGARPPGK